MTRILVIDNYDSFVYNIVQYIGELGSEMDVRRNNTPFSDIGNGIDGIVLSPGPGHPRDSGVTLEILRRMSPKVPTLGVCLGHQAIGEVFGGKVVRADYLLHGKTSEIFHNGEGIFKDVPSPFRATRYHSLVISREDFPSCLEVVAETEKREIMAVRHKIYPIHGVQFHPESIMTQHGKLMLNNFLEVCE